ncbi:hypothetical protein KOR42_23040 [Thalassoglobus neptunius]|uniref:Uncharacterized protein n=1 Tax=Thalassoglobus neptunius TaxID=1938619 RepID=A0A5C5X722_9PLAN|nr:hypothetical protein [Thalassoglobus neptunius]TWT58917.1 hypothetical protein KOR42_23040 [Thalassoglobus neptunius]
MKVTTFIPIHRNDGSPVSPEELQEISRKVWERFGGATLEGRVEGHWVDEQDGQHYQDTSLKLTVVSEPERLPELEQLVREIGRQLDQKAMYFEVKYFDGVRFLRTDE